MKKSLIIYTLLISSLLAVGCSDSSTPNSEPKKSTSTSTSTQTQESPKLEIANTPLYYCPFYINGTSIVFPNWEDNNKISVIEEPYPTNVIQTKDIKSNFSYSTDTLAVINNVIYFANGSDGNHLSSLNLSDVNKPDIKPKVLSKHNVHNIIQSQETLFYLDILKEHKNQNKLYSFNTTDNTTKLITSDTVGFYVVDGNFILYQNLSDNSKLYSVKTDGTQRQQITDYSVNSFAPYQNQILAFNSSDNNNLYTINPTDKSTQRIAIMNGEDLKVYNDKLYFIDLNNSNYLCTLSVDTNTNEATSKILLNSGINEYYPTNQGIMVQKRINVNNTYIISEK